MRLLSDAEVRMMHEVNEDQRRELQKRGCLERLKLSSRRNPGALFSPARKECSPQPQIIPEV